MTQQYMPVAATETHTSLDNAALADDSARGLLDLGHYHARGIVPDIPADVAAAFAQHHRIAAGYRQATANRAAAQRTVDAGQAKLAKVITEAALAGTDPTEAETQVRAELDAARRTLDDTRGIRLGWIKSVHIASGEAMTAVEAWTADVHDHMAAPVAKAAALVAKTRQAYEQAVAAHRELEAVAAWFTAVHLEPGATWPNAFGLAVVDLDADEKGT
jgi:hypothetical protein